MCACSFRLRHTALPKPWSSAPVTCADSLCIWTLFHESAHLLTPLVSAMRCQQSGTCRLMRLNSAVSQYYITSQDADDCARGALQSALSFDASS